MIGSLGIPELLFILVLALLIFGPRKLPEIGRTMGKALGEFRRATSDLKRTLDTELSSEALNRPEPIPQATTPAVQSGDSSATSESSTPDSEPNGTGDSESSDASGEPIPRTESNQN